MACTARPGTSLQTHHLARTDIHANLEYSHPLTRNFRYRWAENRAFSGSSSFVRLKESHRHQEDLRYILFSISFHWTTHFIAFDRESVSDFSELRLRKRLWSLRETATWSITSKTSGSPRDQISRKSRRASLNQSHKNGFGMICWYSAEHFQKLFWTICFKERNI